MGVDLGLVHAQYYAASPRRNPPAPETGQENSFSAAGRGPTAPRRSPCPSECPVWSRTRTTAGGPSRKHRLPPLTADPWVLKERKALPYPHLSIGSPRVAGENRGERPTQHRPVCESQVPAGSGDRAVKTSARRKRSAAAEDPFVSWARILDRRPILVALAGSNGAAIPAFRLHILPAGWPGCASSTQMRLAASWKWMLTRPRAWLQSCGMNWSGKGKALCWRLCSRTRSATS